MKVFHITRETLETHGRNLVFGDEILAATLFAEGDRYAEVCEMRNDLDLDDAYRITQNTDRPWCPAGIHRSTMVGDVIEKDGKLFMVDNFGFTELATDC